MAPQKRHVLIKNGFICQLFLKPTESRLGSALGSPLFAGGGWTFLDYSTVAGLVSLVASASVVHFQRGSMSYPSLLCRNTINLKLIVVSEHDWDSFVWSPIEKEHPHCHANDYQLPASLALACCCMMLSI